MIYANIWTDIESEMRSEEDLEDPHSTPPKLLLFSQRFNKPELEGGLTPPPCGIATIPFKWEQAPGKPRSTTTAVANDPPPQMSKSARSLSLPPRMFTINNKVESIASPTTVLDGPDVGVQSSCWVVGKRKWKIKMPLRNIACRETSPVNFSSWSCDSSGYISSKGSGSRGSSSLSFDSRSYSLDSKININKVNKRRSLFLSDKTTSSILENLYESINQAVTRKR